MNERKGTLVDDLNELADCTDICICLGRSQGGKPTYCMMRT